MLIDVIYPGILGDKAPTANKGKFKAHGWEGMINWADKIGDVNYHIGGTFTYTTNELVDNGGSGVIQAGKRSDREGYPLNSIFGLRYCGKIQTEEQLQKYVNKYKNNSSIGTLNNLRLGDNMFEDVNKDGKLDAEDLVYLGTDDPKMQFSINAGVEWKGLDFSIVFRERENALYGVRRVHGEFRCAQLTKTEVTSLSEILGPRRIPALTIPR